MAKSRYLFFTGPQEFGQFENEITWDVARAMGFRWRDYDKDYSPDWRNQSPWKLWSNVLNAVIALYPSAVMDNANITDCMVVMLQSYFAGRIINTSKCNWHEIVFCLWEETPSCSKSL